MQDRLNQNDVTNQVNVEDTARVRQAVLGLLGARYPGHDLAPLGQAFGDLEALFEGRYPGYLACDTLYHDLRHTLDMSLATARLIDGHERVCAPDERLGPRRAMLGVVIALLHDAGYLRRVGEPAVENGAVHTKVHVSRSAELLSAYLPSIGFAQEAPLAARLVHFTGYEIALDEIAVEEPKDRMLGWMVGTADLIGQMSDRMYLEKCRDFLYQEFVWGGIARETLADGRVLVRYVSPEDLMMKTPAFYDAVARERIASELGAVDRYAEAYFDGPDLYRSEIERNIRFLREAVEAASLGRLRRHSYSLSPRPRAT